MPIQNPERVCAECGTPFMATKGRQAFCATRCKLSFHQTNRTRGQVLLPFLQTWARGRRGGKRSTPNSAWALAQMCAITDQWNRDDAKAGRNAELVVATKRDGGWLAVDFLDPVPRQKK